jgi:hypothetical protein
MMQITTYKSIIDKEELLSSFFSKQAYKTLNCHDFCLFLPELAFHWFYQQKY